LAAFSLENLVEVTVTVVVWLFKFALSLQEEIAGVDEQYKKLHSLAAPQTCAMLCGLASVCTDWHCTPHVEGSQKRCYVDKT